MTTPKKKKKLQISLFRPAFKGEEGAHVLYANVYTVSGLLNAVRKYAWRPLSYKSNLPQNDTIDALRQTHRSGDVLIYALSNSPNVGFSGLGANTFTERVIECPFAPVLSVEPGPPSGPLFDHERQRKAVEQFADLLHAALRFVDHPQQETLLTFSILDVAYDPGDDFDQGALKDVDRDASGHSAYLYPEVHHAGARLLRSHVWEVALRTLSVVDIARWNYDVGYDHDQPLALLAPPPLTTQQQMEKSAAVGADSIREAEDARILHAMKTEVYMRTEPGKVEPNGSQAVYKQYANGERRVAFVRACPVDDNKSPARPCTVYTTGHPDTFLSIPAFRRHRGRRVPGYLAYDTGQGWRFVQEGS